MRADPKRRIISIKIPINILRSGGLIIIAERITEYDSGFSGSKIFSIY
jgi:hypothetical protein